MSDTPPGWQPPAGWSCANCGASNAPDAHSCWRCGEPSDWAPPGSTQPTEPPQPPPPPEPPQPPGPPCRNCFSEVPVGQAFCPRCGTPVQSQQPGPPPPGPPQPPPPLAGLPPPGPPPPGYAGLCRNCFAPIPPGAKVCPRCGAAPDFVPKIKRASNPGPTLLGVIAPFVLAGLGFGVVVTGKGGDSTLLVLSVCLLLAVGLFVTSLVLLSAPRESPRRAFGFAVLMTLLAMVVGGALVLAGLFVICILAIQAQSHH